MPVSEKRDLFLGKVAGLILIILGFLMAASGYRAGSTGYLIGGVVLIAIGAALLVGKIFRRNQD